MDRRSGGWLGAVVLAAALAAATPAAAQTVMVERPEAETRIPGREVTATVRYAEAASGSYKVEAHFYRPFATDRIAEMTIALKSGESFVYAPPLADAPTFRFARDGETLIVTIHRPSRLRLSRNGG
jgi:hypothetical protein